MYAPNAVPDRMFKVAFIGLLNKENLIENKFVNI